MTVDVVQRYESLADGGVGMSSVPANVAAVLEATQLVSSTTLEELVQRAELLARVDRKYFVPVEKFRRLAALVADDFTVLDIDGRCLFGYESVYFDTENLATYRAHLQGRRKRYKLRTRTYLDSGGCMFEVKLKGPRASTVKMRMPHPPDCRVELTPEGLASASRFVAANYGLDLPGGLGPVLTTTNRRATFVSLSESARFTCDVGLRCRDLNGEVVAKDTHVLVESKAGYSGSLVDRTLHDLGVRPVSISKYCIGVAVTHPEVASNPWHQTLRRYFHAPVPSAA